MWIREIFSGNCLGSLRRINCFQSPIDSSHLIGGMGARITYFGNLLRVERLQQYRDVLINSKCFLVGHMDYQCGKRLVLDRYILLEI